MAKLKLSTLQDLLAQRQELIDQLNEVEAQIKKAGIVVDTDDVITSAQPTRKKRSKKKAAKKTSKKKSSGRGRKPRTTGTSAKIRKIVVAAAGGTIANKDIIVKLGKKAGSNPSAAIQAALKPLIKDGKVKKSGRGVWTVGK